MKFKYLCLIIISVLLLFSSNFSSNNEVKINSISKEKILSTNKEWKENYNNYRVDESFIDTLKSKIGNYLTVDVYLATWCGDSRNNVPTFIKIVDSVKSKKLKINYFNVGRKPNKNIKYFVKKFNVERVPTFIFYRDKKELGRIIENPTKSMIEDILEIIF